MKRYNQVPHLTQDTTWESNKNTINIHKQENHVGVDKVTLMILLLQHYLQIRSDKWLQ